MNVWSTRRELFGGKVRNKGWRNLTRRVRMGLKLRSINGGEKLTLVTSSS